jgi:glutamate-1-semialdehyde 2,1-aminomutase
MAAGLKMLELVSGPDVHTTLTSHSHYLMAGFKRAAEAAGIPLCTAVAGGMFGFFFSEESRVDFFDQAVACNVERFKRFFHLMLAEGIYLAPSAFEAGFVSTAHTQADLDTTIAAATRSFAALNA